MTTITALARELDVSREDVETLVGQLVGIDGEDAVIAKTEPVTNGSGREVDHDVHLTADAEATIREQFTATSRVERVADTDIQVGDMVRDHPEASWVEVQTIDRTGAAPSFNHGQVVAWQGAIERRITD